MATWVSSACTFLRYYLQIVKVGGGHLNLFSGVQICWANPLSLFALLLPYQNKQIIQGLQLAYNIIWTSDMKYQHMDIRICLLECQICWANPASSALCAFYRGLPYQHWPLTCANNLRTSSLCIMHMIYSQFPSFLPILHFACYLIGYKISGTKL